jgi:DNA-binding transcriptional regulator/RsmH inhibitor MraZ
MGGADKQVLKIQVGVRNATATAVEQKIVFVGKAQKFQIWDADAYAPIEADALARVKARMERARSGEAT